MAVAGCRSGAPSAIANVEKALASAPPDSTQYWELCRKKADVLADAGRLADAFAWLASLRLADAPPKEQWDTERTWAFLCRRGGRIREADGHLERALSIAASAGNAMAQASLLISRADLLMSLNEVDPARELLDRAEQFHLPRLEPYLRHSRGKLLWKTNRFEQAIGPLTESAGEFGKVPAQRANVLITLGTCYYRLGRMDKAREIYTEALALAAPSTRHLATGHLGNLMLAERRFREAGASFREAAAQAETVSRDFHSMWLSNLASTLIEEKKWAEAEAVNRRALDIERTLDTSLGLDHSRVNEAVIAAGNGRLDDAERLLRALLAEPSVDLGAKLDARDVLAGVFAGRGRDADAEREFLAALELADESRAQVSEDENKLAVLQSLMRVHQDFVRFLMQKNRVAEAVAAAESSRARVLRERMNLPRRPVRRATASEYQAIAQASGSTLLAYWVTPSESWVWAITGTSIRSFPLPDETRLRDLVEKFQGSVETAHQPYDRDSAAKLFTALVPEPVRNAKSYLIVPDGPLYALNFETLAAGNRYWIEDATIAVTPSLDLLAARRTPPRRDKSLLSVGDPDQWDENFEKLINARREIEAIAKRFPTASRTLLTEAAATPDAYLAAAPRNYAYIHFAAHATASRNAPMESAIILSRANGKGRLSVQDVLRTPVSANLVTVSACRSAGARTYSGEGLVGLAWAFVQSGAREVVAGLWKVNDYASPKLMEQLYAGIADGQPPAAALRAAKLNLIAGQKFAEPYYWGALEMFVGALPY